MSLPLELTSSPAAASTPTALSIPGDLGGAQALSNRRSRKSTQARTPAIGTLRLPVWPTQSLHVVISSFLLENVTGTITLSTLSDRTLCHASLAQAILVAHGIATSYIHTLLIIMQPSTEEGNTAEVIRELFERGSWRAVLSSITEPVLTAHGQGPMTAVGERPDVKHTPETLQMWLYRAMALWNLGKFRSGGLLSRVLWR